MICLLSPLGLLCYINAARGPFARNFNKFRFFVLRCVPAFGQLRIQFSHRIRLMALAQMSIPHRHSKSGITHQSAYRCQVRTSHKKVTGEAMADLFTLIEEKYLGKDRLLKRRIALVMGAFQRRRHHTGSISSSQDAPHTRLAIQCDGDEFHGPDRWRQDTTRQRDLERAGWSFWRCFASTWRLHKDEVLTELIERLEKMGIEPVGALDRIPMLVEKRIWKPNASAK